MRRRNRFASWSPLALSLSLVFLGGCGGATEEGLVPVSGRITLDGGAWPKPGKITFTPSGGTDQLRPASADFDTGGYFTVSSFDGVKGLYPGDYLVLVECWEAEPRMLMPGEPEEAAAGKSYVPQKNQSGKDSELKLKVAAGQTPEANFDVKTK
jgi:hypothetical protein